MTSCDYCGQQRPDGELDWIRTGHHTTDEPPGPVEKDVNGSRRLTSVGPRARS